MAKDKNKVAPADGALVKQGSAKRRNRKAWPGDEAVEDKSPKSGKRRDSKKKKKSSKSKEETKEETSSPQRGKQFKAPTQKRTSGLNGAADASSKLHSRPPAARPTSTPWPRKSRMRTARSA